MITMNLYAKIRRLYFRDQLSINEIVRRTGLSRDTVKKWLKQPDGREPSYRRRPMPTKLTPYEGQLKQALSVDSQRPKKERRTALKLLEELRESGYEGGYTQLTDYIRNWRQAEGRHAGKQAFIPLKFAWGEAFQFDWSEESLVIGGLYRRLQVAHIKLCASRVFLLVAYPNQSHEMLFDAHNRAFQAFDGVPLRGIYDNMKTVVDKVQKGRKRIVNTRFAAMTAYYLFEPDFCNVASGWEKGIVEKNVQDSRRRIWLDASQHCFADFAELNRWLEARCRKLWSELSWPDGRDLSLQDALAIEQPHLMPMPGLFDGYIECIARVSSTCLVSVKSNRYSVPCEWAGRQVSVRLYPERIQVDADDTPIACHIRLFDRHQVSYDWQHYIPLLERKPGALRNGAPFAEMPRVLKTLHQALKQRPDGIRAMADLLACIPKQGLPAVLDAVESLLALGPISVEQVQHLAASIDDKRHHSMVNRSAVETPETLILQEEPLANTNRYEQLRSAYTETERESRDA